MKRISCLKAIIGLYAFRNWKYFSIVSGVRENNCDTYYRYLCVCKKKNPPNKIILTQYADYLELATRILKLNTLYQKNLFHFPLEQFLEEKSQNRNKHI